MLVMSVYECYEWLYIQKWRLCWSAASSKPNKLLLFWQRLHRYLIYIIHFLNRLLKQHRQHVQINASRERNWWMYFHSLFFTSDFSYFFIHTSRSHEKILTVHSANYSCSWDRLYFHSWRWVSAVSKHVSVAANICSLSGEPRWSSCEHGFTVVRVCVCVPF